MPFLLLKTSGVLCNPPDCRPYGERLAPYRGPGSADGVRPYGRPRCLPDPGTRQASGVQLPATVQVELHVHASGAAQPKPGPLRLHLQRVQAPRGDPLPLHSVRGENSQLYHAFKILIQLIGTVPITATRSPHSIAGLVCPATP